MKTRHRQEFKNCLDVLSEIHGRDELGGKALTAYWNALEDRMTFQEFEAAIKAHQQDPDRGRFFPKPADLLAKVQVKNPHPQSDAAWALAVRSFDEGESVVWTEQIAKARAIALEVWRTGDETGARLAFRAAYEPLINTGEPPKWILSVGQDPALREDAIRQARTAGLISQRQANELLPVTGAQTDPHIAATAGLLAGRVVRFPEGGKAQAQKLKQAVAEGLRIAEEKRETDARQRIDDAKARDEAKRERVQQELARAKARLGKDGGA